MKIAYLINGQLRVKNKSHADSLNKLFEGGDVFLVTYSEYANTAKYIKHKELIVCKPPKLRQDGLYQYWTLQHALHVLGDQLKNYDLIFRYRTDLQLDVPNLYSYLSELFSTNSNSDCDFYARSDWIFCCKTKLFFELFENVYDDILKKYIDRETIYLPINFNNLRLSLLDNIHHVRWHWLNYPTKYFSLEAIVSDGLIQILTDHSESLENETFDSNTPVITHPVSIRQRQSRPLSTEKFIILFVLQKVPIKHFTFTMKMPSPQVRNRWKIN